MLIYLQTASQRPCCVRITRNLSALTGPLGLPFCLQHSTGLPLGILSGRLSKLLGTADGLRKTTKWVMQRGILGQFRGARNTLYGPPLSLSPAQDWVWLWFEVLEAIGNFTEAALNGGGFYSPEGFPFQKHVTSRSSAWRWQHNCATTSVTRRWMNEWILSPIRA
jgi:hypothetical protein